MLSINGKPFHSSPIQTDSQAFNELQLPSYQGGLTENALITGLVNRTQWGAGYRILSWDVSRNPDIHSSDIPVSVRLQCQSLAPYFIEMICICEFEKQFVLNQSTGQCTVTLGQPPLLPM